MVPISMQFRFVRNFTNFLYDTKCLIALPQWMCNIYER